MNKTKRIMIRRKCELCYKELGKRAYYVFTDSNRSIFAFPPRNLFMVCEKCAILQKLDGNLVSLMGEK